MRRSLSVRPLYEEVITRSPGLRPLKTSMKSLLRRPSWTERLVAPLPLVSTTNTQLPPVSLKKAPFGMRSAFVGIADGELRLDGLAALHRGRFRAHEQQVDLELAVADLRIDLGDFQSVGLAVDVSRRGLPDDSRARDNIRRRPPAACCRRHCRSGRCAGLAGATGRAGCRSRSIGPSRARGY